MSSNFFGRTRFPGRSFTVPRTYTNARTYVEDQESQVAELRQINEQVQAAIASIPEVVADAVNELVPKLVEETVTESLVSGEVMDDAVSAIIERSTSKTRNRLDFLYG